MEIREVPYRKAPPCGRGQSNAGREGDGAFPGMPGVFKALVAGERSKTIGLNERKGAKPC